MLLMLKGSIYEEAAARLNEAGKVVRRHGASDGLGKVQWALLRWLKDPPTDAPTTKEFAFDYGTTLKSAATIPVMLEERGLIERYTSERDTRTQLMRLTNKGWKTLERDPFLEIAEHFEHTFSTTELEVFGDLLGSLLEEFVERGISEHADVRRGGAAGMAELAARDGAATEHSSGAPPADAEGLACSA